MGSRDLIDNSDQSIECHRRCSSTSSSSSSSSSSSTSNTESITSPEVNGRNCNADCRRRLESVVTSCERENGEDVCYTDVLIVGNGPSALSLSAFLAGYHPFYDDNVIHPEPSLREKLATIDKSTSLLQQDLRWLSEELTGRTGHQVSLLYDFLARPGADAGHRHASALSWRRVPDAERSPVSFVTLGKGAVGGAWAEFDADQIALSFASWMDLPAYSFREWLEHEGANFATDLQMKLISVEDGDDMVGRVPCAAIRRYFGDYVKRLRLDRNVFEYALVSSVRRRSDGDRSDRYPWEVRGCFVGRPFHFRCRYVVLAAGVSVPRRLDLPDEHRAVHTLPQLDQYVAGCTAEQKRLPVLVVGDGLSAADAVIRCLINDVPVVHVFRKTPKDPKQILSKLSKLLYPDYHTVFQLMTGQLTEPLYAVRSRTEVQALQFSSSSSSDDDQSGFAVLRGKSGLVESVQFARAAVLIGFQANLDFLHRHIDADTSQEQLDRQKLVRDPGRAVDSKTNTLNVDPFTCRSSADPDLYAVGPLIGDNYVRYVVGGSMAVAADIYRRFQ